MYDFLTNCDRIVSELQNEIRLFYDDAEGAPAIVHFAEKRDGLWCNIVTIDGNVYRFEDDPSDFGAEAENEKFFARCCKRSIYRALKAFSGKEMPWGSLTGIRPTKMVYELLSKGLTERQICSILMTEYDVSAEKTDLIASIVRNQKSYVTTDPHAYNLYVHIPFCTSKCTYCSFITYVSGRCKGKIDPYCDLLTEEIRRSQGLERELGNRVDSVYVGGGTPTALDETQLEQVLRAVDAQGREFTCEAGRPDTITNEKLEIMKRYGVTRVCVNPQSFHDKTLALIGRSHSVDDFYRAYEMVKRFGFDVNIDLIAGLPEENAEDFALSLQKAIALRPENLTVHTLSRKNGSQLKESGRYDNAAIEEMIAYSSQAVGECGYRPYYLYRQKSMLGNLENTGYSLVGKECANNVTTMEEFLSVNACGAGAISKRVDGRGRIERLANLREIGLYGDQFEQRWEKKKDFIINSLKNGV